MINQKSVLAIIPARGGSKGLPKKNIKLMNGKPLIQWTIETALQTTEIDSVLVTTDCPEIQSVALAVGAECPFLRPDALASDTATSFDAVKHSLDYYAQELGREFDIIVLLEPTSPLRENTDISNMLSKLEQHYQTHDGIVSLGKCLNIRLLSKLLIMMEALFLSMNRLTLPLDDKTAQKYIFLLASLMLSKEMYY